MSKKLSEAITIKARVKAFLKAAGSLLGEKELPEGVRTRVTDLQADMNKTWADLAAEIANDPVTESAALETGFIPLVERSVDDNGTVPLKLIAPGWGSSGYYPADVLERDGPETFKAGLKMYWNHPTEAQEAERPERDLRDLAAELVSDARWQADGQAGPGLYAEAIVFDPFRGHLDQLAPHIGVSIRALGRAKEGEAEGKVGPIIEEVVGARSVDFVTEPGAGGRILQLFEAARKPITKKEESIVDEKEAQELKDQNAALAASVADLQKANDAMTAELATLKTEAARMAEAALVSEAKAFVRENLDSNLPDITKDRLVESLGSAPVVKDGALDQAAYKTVIEEASKAEVAYIAKATGRGTGQITGMGRVSGIQTGAAALKESFKGMYLKQGFSEDQAEAMASDAARGR